MYFKNHTSVNSEVESFSTVHKNTLQQWKYDSVPCKACTTSVIYEPACSNWHQFCKVEIPLFTLVPNSYNMSNLAKKKTGIPRASVKCGLEIGLRLNESQVGTI